MFDYYKKLDALSHINRVLLSFSAVLVLVIAGLIYALVQMPSKMEFWLSPSMSASGGLVKPDDIPDEYVHGFVTSLIPALNSWSKTGESEFYENTQAFRFYFTPRYQELMERNWEAMKKAGLFSRTQTTSLYRFMEPGDVKKLSQGLWDVHMVLRVTQKLNEQSTMIIADKVVDYHFRIVKVNLSKVQNPFQLAIDGYSRPERLVKDLLSKEQKEGVL